MKAFLLSVCALITLGLTLSTRALAHEGHGQAFLSHWHASDALGLAVGLLVACVLWLAFRGK